MRPGEGRYRACGFVVSGGSAPSRGFIVFTSYASRHRLLVSLFLSYPMPLGTREFAHCGGRGSMDHGGSWDGSRLLDIEFCQPHEFLQSSFSFGSVWLLSLRRRDISPILSLASLAHES